VLGPSLPKVTKIHNSTRGKQGLDDLRKQHDRNFPMIKKVVTVKKTGGIYTPRPSTTIIVLSILNFLTSSLLRTSSSLSLMDSSTFTTLPVRSRLMSSLSEVPLSLFVHF